MKEVERLKAEGKIQGYEQRILKAPVVEIGGRKVVKHFKQRTPEKDCLYREVHSWANWRGLDLFEEYVFHPQRKWRLDLLLSSREPFIENNVPMFRLAVEYEGIFSKKSRHTTKKGFSGDCDKYREAAKMGIVVLRYTAMNHRQVLSDLNEQYEKVYGRN